MNQPSQTGGSGRDNIELVSTASVVRDASAWPRLATDEDRVAYFRDVFDDLPPITVEAGSLRLIDGWHRVEAALRLGRDQVPANVVATPAEGILAASIGFASRAAKPLSREERRHAITLLLKEDARRSDRWLASIAGVSAATVASTRAELEVRAEVEAATHRLGRDGVERSRPRERPERELSQPDFGREIDGFDPYDDLEDAPAETHSSPERRPQPRTDVTPITHAQNTGDLDEQASARRYIRDLLDLLSQGSERYSEAQLIQQFRQGAPGFPPERARRTAAAWAPVFRTAAEGDD